jgi:hypothetical protein
MLIREIEAPYSKNHDEKAGRLCRQNAGFGVGRGCATCSNRQTLTVSFKDLHEKSLKQA